MSEYLVMGVDPSYAKGMAYGILNGESELVGHGIISAEQLDSPQERAYLYQKLFADFIEKHKITYLVCEDQYSGVNADGFKKLVLVTGGVVAGAISTQTPYATRHPATWRKITHNAGNIKKDISIQMIIDKYGLELKKKDYDIAEAIGIAYSQLVVDEKAEPMINQDT